VRGVVLGGLNSSRHQEQALVVLASCWHPWNMPPGRRGTVEGDMAAVSEAVRESIRRGAPRVLGRMAILLANLLGAPASFVSQHAACFAAFVSDLCAAMGSCAVDDVVSLTRALACASAGGASRAVLLAVCDDVRSSAERAAEASSDARLVDHALVLLRNVLLVEKSAAWPHGPLRWCPLCASPGADRYRVPDGNAGH